MAPVRSRNSTGGASLILFEDSQFGEVEIGVDPGFVGSKWPQAPITDPLECSGSLREPTMDRRAIPYNNPADRSGSLRKPTMDRRAIHYNNPAECSGSLREPTHDR